MLDWSMPNQLKKRRVVFIPDCIWKKLELESEKNKISRSCALRKILIEKWLKN